MICKIILRFILTEAESILVSTEIIRLRIDYTNFPFRYSISFAADVDSRR